MPPPYDPNPSNYSEIQRETTNQTTNVAEEYHRLNHTNTCSQSDPNADATYSAIDNGQQQLTGAASPVYDTVHSEQGKYHRAKINLL